MIQKAVAILLGVVLGLFQPGQSHGQGSAHLPPELQGIGIFPQLGNQVSLDTPVTDENGKTLPLRTYFDGKRPVVLILAYYGCPMLCGMMLGAAREAFATFPWPIGERFQIVTISIDPKETFELARDKKENFLADWPNGAGDNVKNGWHFLTAAQNSSEKIASEVGFRYKFVPEEKQYAHSPGLFFLSPEGKLSRVLGGITYSPQDVKLALLEASEGKIGSIAEKILLFCYSYDPKANKYALLANRLMKAGGALTVAVIAFTYLFLYVRRRLRRREV